MLMREKNFWKIGSQLITVAHKCHDIKEKLTLKRKTYGNIPVLTDIL